MSADADARCRICGLDETEDGNLIVICEGCEVAVHQVRARTLYLLPTSQTAPPDSSAVCATCNAPLCPAFYLL
jgi:hypothetical protein